MRPSPSPRRVATLALLLTAALTGGCTGGRPVPRDADDAPAAAGGSDRSEPAPTIGRAVDASQEEDLLARYDVSIPTVRYEWDPQAGDPTVPAELGGPGFTGEGWETNLEFPALGSPDAVPGGTMTLHVSDWPPTLRMDGKDWNASINYTVSDLITEGLIDYHRTTLEYIPRLATHWWISPDKMTYRFRINPKARWSDGSEVTAHDVVATYRFKMDPELLYPSNIQTYGKLEEPVALSKYVVEVRCKQENWRNFLYFGTMRIFPASEISMPAPEWLKKYQNAYMAVSGPYRVRPEDIVMGQSVALTRRDDWWDRDNPAWTGYYNIGRYEWVVVKDQNLAFEKVKRGELDLFMVNKAAWWVEELDEVDAVQRGLLLKRKFYNDFPVGTSGIAINQRRPPLDDVRMREALQLLYDRQTFIEKLFHREYAPLTSYWQGGTYQNPVNEVYPYDEFGAVELLEDLGWTEINDEGYRVKDGSELAFTLTYRTPSLERIFTVYQEACKRAGIRLDLQLVTPAAGWKNLRQKEYDLFAMAWGAIIFPNPESSYHGNLADKVDNNNVTSYSNPKVDALCEAYDREYDVARRAEIIREIDGIIYRDHPYVLGWYLPSIRIVHWNKYSMPKWGVLRTMRNEYMHYCWWVDPEKEAALAAAREDESVVLGKPEVDNRFWQAWNAARRRDTPAQGGAL